MAILWLDADEFEVGVLTAMTTAGSLLIWPPAGAWVDRWRKRPVMVNTDLLRAALLYAIALGHGLLTVLFEVGYTNYVPTLVGRDHLVEANSRIAAARSAVSISGPGLAGPLVGWLGAPLTLIVSAAGMLLSALGMLRIRTVEVVRPEATDRQLIRRLPKDCASFSVIGCCGRCCSPTASSVSSSSCTRRCCWSSWPGSWI